MIDLVNWGGGGGGGGGKKIVNILKMGAFEMGPTKIWMKW